jgi:universal stress protein A
VPGVKTRIEKGAPKQEIVRVADDEKAELIVIGSHGRHGLQLLLGSTANGVLHLAKCDVLAVRVNG